MRGNMFRRSHKPAYQVLQNDEASGLEPTQLEALFYNLPVNLRRYPQFSILSVTLPSHVIDAFSVFRHLLVITELHLPAPAVQLTMPIVRTHYFYSTDAVPFVNLTHCIQQLNELQEAKRLIIAHQWVTQALYTPTQVQHYQEFMRIHRPYQIPTHETEMGEFWEALYGLYERHSLLPIRHTAPLFSPFNFSTDQTDLHFMPHLALRDGRAFLPEATPDDVQYSETIPEGVYGSCGAQQALTIANDGLQMASAVICSIQGKRAISPDYNRPLGLANAAFWGAGLLLENISFLSTLERDSYKDVDTWLSGSSLLCSNASYALWIHNGVTNVAKTGTAAAFADLGVATFAAIMDAREIYKSTRKKADMARCLKQLEDYFAAGQMAGLTGQISRELKNDDYQWHAENASLYVMISWLSRKYQRCTK